MKFRFKYPHRWSMDEKEKQLNIKISRNARKRLVCSEPIKRIRKKESEQKRKSHRMEMRKFQYLFDNAKQRNATQIDKWRLYYALHVSLSPCV